ncbi:MAG: alpha/beta hydrolase [Cellvibrionaceae bacterium]
MPEFLSNQRRLCFDDSGGKGEPVLLLHGLGSRSVDWQQQVEALASDYRVLTLDFPGHGRSDPLRGPVSMAELAADACALLDHLKIPSVHVAGLSLGGMVAFQLAVDCPERLRSLVVINAAPGPGALGKRFKLQIASRILLIRLCGLQVLAKRIAPKLFPLPEQQALREQFLASVAAADKQSYLHIVRAIGRFDVSRGLADCAIPALIMAADQDYTPVDFKRDFVARMRSAQLTVVPDSRHATPLDSPQVCNREIFEFLLRQSASPHGQERSAAMGAN